MTRLRQVRGVFLESNPFWAHNVCLDVEQQCSGGREMEESTVIGLSKSESTNHKREKAIRDSDWPILRRDTVRPDRGFEHIFKHTSNKINITWFSFCFVASTFEDSCPGES